jgi:hypothetical protein
VPLDLDNIDPRFVNVDFTREALTHGYSLGYAGVGEAVNRMRSYGEVVPEMTESELRAEIEKLEAAGGGAERLVTRIYDQNGEGSCVANACAQANEIVQALQFGKENVVHLSAMSLYKRIGSGPNSGAMVSDGLDEMQARGVLPLDNPENRARFGDKVMPNCGWRTPYPADWEAVAAQFCVVEAFVVRNVRQLMTALVRQEPAVVGRAGHSVVHVRPTWKDGFASIYPNSWGQWGFGAGDFDYGFGMDTGRLLSSAAQWAFVVRAVRARK